MTWWSWTLVFLLLVVGSGVFLFRVGLRLWRQASALLTEMGEASDRMAQVSEQLQTLGETLGSREQELAVFLDPVALRQERDRQVRRRYARGRTLAARAVASRRASRA